jgi:MFS family permease
MQDARASTPPRLWTVTFVLVCVAAFFSYINYAFLAPIIPLFVDSLGGSSATVGLALAAFSTVSFLMRPIVGYLVDAGRARGVFGVGSLLVSLGTLFYFAPNLAAVFAGRVVQGIGWAGLNTGSYAMVARLAPPERRGAASGYFQVALALPIAFLPSVALWLHAGYGFNIVFALSAATSAISAALTLLIASERRPESRPVTGGLLASMVEPSAFLPSALLFLVNLAFPAAVFFIPLYARELAIPDVAIFFLVQGVVNVAAQAGLGGLSDRFGRSPTIALGLVVGAAGLVMMGWAGDLIVLSLGGALYTLGWSLVNPALLALVIDRTHPDRRGAAMATYLLSYQLGAAVGSFAGGYLILWFGYRALYLAVAAPMLAGLLILRAMRRGTVET